MSTSTTFSTRVHILQVTDPQGWYHHPAAPASPSAGPSSLALRSETIRRKRASGLDLLRPRTSSGRRSTDAPGSQLTQTASTFIRSTSSQGATTSGDGEPDAAAARREEKFSSQRAVLRPSRSIPRLPSTPSPAASPSPSLSPSLTLSPTSSASTLPAPSSPSASGTGSLSPTQPTEPKGKSKASREGWEQAEIKLVVNGLGGVYGGTLAIRSASGIRQISLPPSRRLRHASCPLRDVRLVHRSLTGRLDVVQLTIQEGASDAGSRRPSGAQGIDTELGEVYRSRRSSATTSPPKPSGTPRKTSTSSSKPDQKQKGSETQDGDAPQPQTFFCAFSSWTETTEWFTLLRSFSASPDKHRTARRLQVRILDVTERVPVSTGLGIRDDRGSLLGPSVSVDTKSLWSRDGRWGKDKERIKPGWAARDAVCCEVLVDGTAHGRTSFQAAQGSPGPFWGENFSVDDILETCKIRLCRRHKARVQYFADVDIPLVAGYDKAKDERYPVVDIAGSVIGELRMVVVYTEVNVLSLNHYSREDVPGLYNKAAQGHLDGLSDCLVRIGASQGTLSGSIQEMCRIEAQASEATLFRGNTPLSKLLEATMRTTSRDFLLASIAPTINRILSGVELLVYDEVTGAVRTEDLGIMLGLVEDCWRDMLDHRDTFPQYLRPIFTHLFERVKEFHPDEDKLEYKAVSSFLFLRLIGPAIMRPHLFDIADGLPSPGVRRTLTLLAKILHALAFFTDLRDPELSLFAPFVKSHTDSMLEYLAAIIAPADVPTLSPITAFIAERRSRLSHDRIPLITPCGPVDLAADLATLYETLYHRDPSDPTLSHIHTAAASRVSEDRSHGSLSLKTPSSDSTSSSGSLREKMGSPTWKWLKFGRDSPLPSFSTQLDLEPKAKP